jgi:hypothetical protein
MNHLESGQPGPGMEASACRSIVPAQWRWLGGVLALVVWTSACSRQPPAPPPELRAPAEDVETLVAAIRMHPTALFHPEAEPAATRLGSELRRLVETARAPYGQSPDGLHADSEASRSAAEQAASTAGSIVAVLTGALRCAGEARIERKALERTAVAAIEAAGALGADLTSGEDAREWASRQEDVRRLALPLYDLAKGVPPDVRDELVASVAEAERMSCPP